MQTPQSQATAAPAPAQPAPGAAPAQPQGETPVTVRVILAAMKIIYTNPKPFLDLIASADDPRQGIAVATHAILEKIAKSVTGVPPETIQKALPVVTQKLGPVIGSLLAELAVAAGVMPDPAGEASAKPAGLVSQAQQAEPATPGGA